jgi:hypothetical protein
MSQPQTPTCPYCGRVFQSSRFRPVQRICSRAECQQRRRREDHQKRRLVDPVYRQTCLNSQRKWREAHPDYCRNYRRRRAEAKNNLAGPAAGAKNTLARGRPDWIVDLKDLERTAKNNLAFGLDPDSVWVFRLPAAGAQAAKNTLAFPQALVLLLDRAAQQAPRTTL